MLLLVLYSKRKLVLLVPLFFLLSTFHMVFYLKGSNDIVSYAKHCFQLKVDRKDIIFIEDISESEIQPSLDRCIFFHETSCSTNGIISLNARQACAVESAARLNPNRDIFVIYASPVGFSSSVPMSPIMNALSNYSNVNYRSVNIYDYAKGTPADHWIKNEKIFSSGHVIEHISDYLRLLTLYKFGGIYFDLDTITQKNLDNMPLNFACAKDDQVLGNAVMAFESTNSGHKIVEMIIKENTENYQSDQWAFSGPGAITRVLQRVCNVEIPSQMKPDICLGFKVYSTNVFYPIYPCTRERWQVLFDTNRTIVEEALERTKDSKLVHFWSSATANKKIRKSGSRNTYSILAERYCPNVYASSGLYF